MIQQLKNNRQNKATSFIYST